MSKRKGKIFRVKRPIMGDIMRFHTQHIAKSYFNSIHHSNWMRAQFHHPPRKKLIKCRSHDHSSSLYMANTRPPSSSSSSHTHTLTHKRSHTRPQSSSEYQFNITGTMMEVSSARSWLGRSIANAANLTVIGSSASGSSRIKWQLQARLGSSTRRPSATSLQH